MIVENSVEYDPKYSLYLTSLILHILRYMKNRTIIFNITELRSVVNDEVNEIFYALKLAEKYVSTGGDVLFYLGSRMEVSNLLNQIDASKFLLEEKFVSKNTHDALLHFVTG